MREEHLLDGALREVDWSLDAVDFDLVGTGDEQSAAIGKSMMKFAQLDEASNSLFSLSSVSVREESTTPAASVVEVVSSLIVVIHSESPALELPIGR